MVEVKETDKAEKVQSFLDEGDTREFRKFYLEMHPYDQAVFFKDQSDENRLKIYSYLSPKEMSVIKENVVIKESEKFITEMDPRFATMVITEMEVDDAVDILQELSKDEVASFLAILDKEASQEIKTLLHYEDKTAGSIMTTEYVSILNSSTAKKELFQMKKEAPDAETIYYTYVLDDQKKLVGVLSLRNLIIADEDDIIENIMSENVVSVSVGRETETTFRSEEHTSELQSRGHLVCRLLLEKKKNNYIR